MLPYIPLKETESMYEKRGFCFLGFNIVVTGNYCFANRQTEKMKRKDKNVFMKKNPCMSELIQNASTFAAFIFEAISKVFKNV